MDDTGISLTKYTLLYRARYYGGLLIFCVNTLCIFLLYIFNYGIQYTSIHIPPSFEKGFMMWAGASRRCGTAIEGLGFLSCLNLVLKIAPRA